MKSKDWAKVLAYLSIALAAATAILTLVPGTVPVWAVMGTLLSCVASFIAWFVIVFTGDAREKAPDMFVFAYVFTFVSLGLLLLPLRSEPTGDSSPIAVLRGCATNSSADPALVPYPRSMTCQPEAATSNGERQAIGELDRVAQSEPQTYLMLLAVGGVRGNKHPAECGTEPRCGYVRITSGLAVPLYIVILAFVGGAVSLSRRIPEYQKRSDPAYVGTKDQPSLAAVDAREAVVFQIMQLISAPFIAMAAYYIIGPATLAAAIGLGFGCGFASEPILLMIRGAISGIRPESSRLAQSVAGREVVSGTVTNGQGPVVGAQIQVDELPGFSTWSTRGGAYLVPDLAFGSYTIRASAGAESGFAIAEITEGNKSVVDISIKSADPLPRSAT